MSLSNLKTHFNLISGILLKIDKYRQKLTLLLSAQTLFQAKAKFRFQRKSIQRLRLVENTNQY